MSSNKLRTQRLRRISRASRRLLQRLAVGSILGTTLLGCATNPELKYLGGDKELNYYKTAATSIDYPAVETQTSPQAQFAQRPRTVFEREKADVWNVTLSESIQLAIQNNRIVRARSSSSAPSAILSAGDNSRSTYDPAIQESGVLFGGRGIAAALSAFDAQLNSSMIWGRSEVPQNNAFFGGGVGGGTALVTETGAFNSTLSKQFGYGGNFTLGHTVNYSGNNIPAGAQLFRSAYTGNASAQYTQPLLAGAGAEFTRIAGPISQSFGGLSGVNQGVVIARINHDITLADFEASVLTMLKDVEDLYWELYLSYRQYDTAVTARNSALQSWREAHRILEAGGKPGFKPSDEAQARDFYFQTRAATEAALSNVYSAEIVFRRILGLPVNDGRMIRPSDEPTTAGFRPSWEVSLTEALTQRVELRRQKWNVKSLELQLTAAKSLTRPSLNFVSGYQINGLGNDLFGNTLPSTASPAQNAFPNLYNSITGGQYTGWNLGFTFQMPLGFRAAHAQVRNLELRLAKARDILQAQEVDISHEVAQDFQNIAVQYTTAQSNFNRLGAAQQRVQLFRAEVEAGTKTFDVLLRALTSQAEAEVAYFRSLTEYNKAIVALHYHKGTLLPYDDVWLGESDWTPEAYCDALRQAWARTHAIDAPHLETEPAEFVAQPDWRAQELSAPSGTPPEPAVPYEAEVELPTRAVAPTEPAKP